MLLKHWSTDVVFSRGDLVSVQYKENQHKARESMKDDRRAIQRTAHSSREQRANPIHKCKQFIL